MTGGRLGEGRRKDHSPPSVRHLKVGEINGANDPSKRIWQVHGFSGFHPPALLPRLSGKEGEHLRRSVWNVSFWESC